MQRVLGVFSDRCRSIEDQDDAALAVESFHEEQSEAGVDTNSLVISVEFETDPVLTPLIHTEDGLLVLVGGTAPWIVEDGQWKHDGCIGGG